jgi:outer membrane usher protein
MAIRLAGALLLAAACANAQPPKPPDPSPVELLVYSIQVNGRAAGDAVLLRLDGTRLLARESDWDSWHLVRPDTRYDFEGESYYALDQAPGFVATLDAPKQEARLEFAAQAFAPSVFSASPDRRVTPQPPPGFGGFVNYEFLGTRREADNADASSNLNGLFEAGIFNPDGVLTSQWLGQNLADEEPDALNATPRHAVRLETAITRDFSDTMETLRLGDGTGAAGLWGRPVRAGGLRWTRNFSTQPGFVTLPQPSLRGETSLPSVLDVYVDGLRRQSLDVPPGPFTVENLPTLTGQGEVQVVVRDLLGREQLLTDSYIAGAQQLKAGLSDYSYEAGFEREQFGRASNEYGDFFVAGTQRYGFTDDFTGEARFEVFGSDSVAGGLGGTYALPRIAVISNAFAVSQSSAGNGALDVLTVQHSTRRGLSLGARLQAASAYFTQLGLPPGVAVPQRSFGANLGYPVPPLGRFGLGYVNREERAPATDFEAVTATFNTSFRRVSLTLLAIDRKRPQQEYSVGLTVSMPFGSRDTASTGYRQRDSAAGEGSSQSFARVQRNLPDQEGWGYRVLVSENQSDNADNTSSGEAGAGLNGPYGSYAVEAATFDEVETYRATVSGGVGTLGGHTFASRKLSRSFAVVETGAEDIELLVNNRLAGRTDANGVAVLPYLQPYQNNIVRIDTTNVPLDIEVQSGEFKAAPYYRSGVLIPLDVRRTRSALLSLLQADGSPVPSGAVVRLGPGGAEVPVAKNGQAYVSGLAPGDNTLDVRWNGHVCAITFTLPEDAGVQPRLGPYTCP